MAGAACLSRYSLRVSMGIKVTFKDGIFEPLKDVKGVPPWQTYTVFSDEELKRDPRDARVAEGRREELRVLEQPRR